MIHSVQSEGVFWFARVLLFCLVVLCLVCVCVCGSVCVFLGVLLFCLDAPVCFVCRWCCVSQCSVRGCFLVCWCGSYMFCSWCVLVAGVFPACVAASARVCERVCVSPCSTQLSSQLATPPCHTCRATRTHAQANKHTHTHTHHPATTRQHVRMSTHGRGHTGTHTHTQRDPQSLLRT